MANVVRPRRGRAPRVCLLLAAGCAAAGEPRSEHPSGSGDGGLSPGPPAADGGPDAPATPEDGGAPEPCDHFDNDLDGVVDEGCACTPGETATCYPWPPTRAGEGVCQAGTHRCEGDGEFGSRWGPCEGGRGPDPIDEFGVADPCGDGVDSDCDGADGVDCDDPPLEGCHLELSFETDCVTVSCPAHCPYPVACDIYFTPGDRRACIANAPGSASVYLQNGDQCNAGYISGTLTCSDTAGGPLTQESCPIPLYKDVRLHVEDPSDCPETHD